MKRLTDPKELHRLIQQNARDADRGQFSDCEKWLQNPAHFALVEGDDLSLFMAEDRWPGPLHAHVMFKSRGKRALEIARRMLDYAWSFQPTEMIASTTYRDAALFARWLGFKQTAIEDCPHGRYYVLKSITKAA